MNKKQGGGGAKITINQFKKCKNKTKRGNQFKN